MSTTEAETGPVVQPPPPTTRTVVVTTSPQLIPDENATAYCLTRRNIFDAVIAILLVAAIIYFVLQWRSGGRMPFTGLTRTMNTGARGFGNTSARGTGVGQQMNRMGQQIAGSIKRFFK